MAEVEESVDRLHHYGLVSRNAYVMLMMEPPEHGLVQEITEAREKVAVEATDFLGDVLEGIESSSLTTYVDSDRRYIDHLAVEEVRASQQHHPRGFVLIWPPIHVVNPSEEIEAATFAYFAASSMVNHKTPFYRMLGARASVEPVHNLAEFREMVELVKGVTSQSYEGCGFYKVVKSPGWRTSVAFWDATRQFAGSFTGEAVN